MRADRKAAREFVKSIKTRRELEEYLNMLNLSTEERTIAMMIFAEGWSRRKIAFETGYSEDQIKRKIVKIYSKMV